MGRNSKVHQKTGKGSQTQLSFNSLAVKLCQESSVKLAASIHLQLRRNRMMNVIFY